MDVPCGFWYILGTRSRPADGGRGQARRRGDVLDSRHMTLTSLTYKGEAAFRISPSALILFQTLYDQCFFAFRTLSYPDHPVLLHVQ